MPRRVSPSSATSVAASARTSRAPNTGDATPFVPSDPKATLVELHQAAEHCKGCPLYKTATQVVFGELASHVEPTKKSRLRVPMMLLGEQPGNDEDLAGRPFVGPAGKLLDRALDEAGIERARVYVTNAVKHFKWVPAPRGKRRIHSKPTMGEVRACRPWLQRELMLVQPTVIVCLGATAGQSLLGPSFRVGTMRGRELPTPDELQSIIGEAKLFATIHPSAILRVREHDDREREYRSLVDDLRAAVELAAS